MNMISDARGGHVSPGIYTEEKDVTYSVKSLGITSLGLVGETLYGPAFENVEIKDWSEFVDYFGGTSPEKFKGTGAPKYELPYIAKSYLEESKRLNVVRVLGLSGYHAGPAYVVKKGNTPVAVLRSKMSYSTVDGSFNCSDAKSEKPNQLATSLTLGAYDEKIAPSPCATAVDAATVTGNKFSIIVNNDVKYNVSLNPNDNDYIYRVLSDSSLIYVESVFENIIPNSGTFSLANVTADTITFNAYFKRESIEENKDKDNNTTGYTAFYKQCEAKEEAVLKKEKKETNNFKETATAQTELNEYRHYQWTVEYPIYDDYVEPYRAAQTPWLVSEVHAGTIYEMKKLFRIITISDGDASNFQVKVSIQNIKPLEGYFDVVVRDFNDTDDNIVILEKFAKCSMAEGDSSYVGYKIGTSDGGYISKSKYITLEMADNGDLSGMVPCGFLGYPMPYYGDKANKIDMSYNLKYDDGKKSKKQYFGLTNTGNYKIDEDVLKYKGKTLYGEDLDHMTSGFHMDSTLDGVTANSIYVDGKNGYSFKCVSSGNGSTVDNFAPRITTSTDGNGVSYMNQSIYKDINLRKFTVYFYGGFDGWDIHREERTNADKYKASNFSFNNTTNVFSKISESFGNGGLNLPSTAITSDYYAYLAGYRVFANPQDIDINIFATPGINWNDNTLLTEDVIDMIEDAEDGRGGDALYVMACPQCADVEDVVSNFESTEIDTSYACTYFPWVMYFDSSNSKYLSLPATKDVVRNMASTDNKSYPWFAPAGIERGNVRCIKADFKTTLAEEDTLYENNINPVKSFSQDGVKIWGNKTTYKTDSPLNRVNVRRLMIRVKKLVMDASKSLIFEQYDDSLEKQFRGLVEPILADVKSNRGIYDYRIMTECTEETRDQHILPAKILIKPTPALEYISLSFVVYPESVEFEEN